MKTLLIVAVVAGIVGAITLIYATDQLKERAAVNP
jgi:hypothetical protein